MPKPSGTPHPDPMSREVDRLLARLAAGHRDAHEAPRAAAGQRPPRPVVGVARRSGAPPTRAERVVLWARVALGVGFGAFMTQWPYSHGCGWPLAGYLGAVAMVLLAGGWIALASWELRSGVAHLLALVLFFWGIVLAAEQLLPRTGYAAERASWQCGAQSRG